MSLPFEVEELLDVLRNRVIDQELEEIEKLYASGLLNDLENEEMRTLQKLLLEAKEEEAPRGFVLRQKVCEDIARVKYATER